MSVLFSLSTVSNRQGSDDENVAPEDGQDGGAEIGNAAADVANNQNNNNNEVNDEARPVLVPRRVTPTTTPATTFGKVPTPNYKVTKRAQDANALASDVITSVLKKDEDEIDLAFASLAMRIRKQLNPVEVLECMMEVEQVVGRYMRVALHRRTVPSAAAGAPPAAPVEQPNPGNGMGPPMMFGEMNQLLQGAPMPPGVVEVEENRNYFQL